MRRRSISDASRVPPADLDSLRGEGAARCGGPPPLPRRSGPVGPKGRRGYDPPQGTSNSSAGIRGSGAFAPADLKAFFRFLSGKTERKGTWYRL